MSSQTSQKSHPEVIDLTNETTLHEKTITLDDSISLKSESQSSEGGYCDYLQDRSPPPIIAIEDLDDEFDVLNSSSSTIKSTKRLSSPLEDYSNSPPRAESPEIRSEGSSTCSPPPRHFSSQPILPSEQSPMLTKKGTPRRPAAKKTKLVEQALARQQREEIKRQKLKQKEEDKLVREVNRTNAANKALENCTANIDPKILKIVNDPDEESFRTLYDESMIKYRLTEYAKIENSITWTYKRSEIVDGVITPNFKDSKWIIVIMEGSEYLERILAYRQNPDSSKSIKNHLSDIRNRSKSDVVLMVYNLANHMKNERVKDAKNYRKTFKDRFEGVSRAEPGDSSQDESPNVMSVGPTELQDLRLMLEIEFKRSHSDWKLHIEFYEKKIDIIQAVVRYTLSIARYEVKQKARASTGLDWAINMDKERAVDPTKSAEDLTRLWVTQLQQFAQITLPIAKSIASEYQSPCALLDQYKILTTSEAEGLLAELYVQRNLKRKIGMNISKRIHCFMTCEDPDVHIGLS